jgi:alpha-D-ribose 1-methylphosphonate 5-triphosphate synthase subunit PhnH
MKQEELQKVVPGFHDPVAGSQAVFRCALQALSLPGRALEVPPVAQGPNRGHGAAARLLLALLDSDCSLWLSPSLEASDARAWLRFHTGCRCVDDPSQADFLWLASGDDWPRLEVMDGGSDEYPDQSATCVMEVDRLIGGPGGQWVLEGPGIDGRLGVSVQGLPSDFEDQWRDNHAAFPRGVDVFLATPTQLMGLPRSTRLSASDTVEV